MIEQAIAYIETMQDEGRIKDYEYEVVSRVLDVAYDYDWCEDSDPGYDGKYFTYGRGDSVPVIREYRNGRWYNLDGSAAEDSDGEIVDYWRLLPDVPRFN